jgi:hypothetical protein
MARLLKFCSGRASDVGKSLKARLSRLGDN